MRIKIKIAGVSPLLMCKCSPEALSSEGRRKNKNMTPREEAEGFAYRLPNKELYIPIECMYKCIMAAGAYHKIGKNKITTQKSSLIPAGLFVVSEYCNLGTKDYEVDSRPVVVPATGGRIMRHRPRLDKWTTDFELDIDENMFSEDLVRTLVDDAGSKCGVLSFRPSCKGWFGRFKVVKWEAKKS
jgi:hypothetical protein